jgi:hypothetical protein
MNASLGSRVIGEYPTIPDKYQAAMRFGVRFFECHFLRPTQYSHPIMGPWDIKVTEEITPGTWKPRFFSKVLTGPEAQVRYEVVTSRGLAIAFMFDDKFWHNRLIIIDNPSLFHVVQMHTRDGIISGTEIMMEINALRETIMEQTEIFRILRSNGFEVDRAETRKEADEIVIDLKQQAAAGERPEWKKMEKFTIVPTMITQKKSQVRDLIEKYSKTQYGWTDSPEFENEIKPEVVKLIEKRRSTLVLEGSAGAAFNLQDALEKALSGMSDDRIASILARRQLNKTLGDEETSEPKEMTGGEEEASKWSKSGLQAKSMPEIMEVANALGVQVKGKPKKEKVIDLILEKQDEIFKKSITPIPPDDLPGGPGSEEDHTQPAQEVVAQ